MSSPPQDDRTLIADARRGFALSYPSSWVTKERIKDLHRLSRGACFVAAGPEGNLLFEVYSLQWHPLRKYLDLYQEISRKEHLNTRVLGQSSKPLESGHHCARLTVTDLERATDGTKHEFTTDYFLVDAGTKVLSLNFKVLTAAYAVHEPEFRKVVASLRVG